MYLMIFWEISENTKCINSIFRARKKSSLYILGQNVALIPNLKPEVRI